MKFLPKDFMIPFFTFSNDQNHWGNFGAFVHPEECSLFLKKLGLYCWTSPSNYGSKYNGNEHAIYWLYIRKINKIPFELTF